MIYRILPLLLWFSSSLSAQNLGIRQFTVDDGLPSNHVYEVKQDSKGYYWIATDHGVVKYDGYTFKKIEGPFGQDIWWTHEDSKGRIWGITVGKDLWYLENDSAFSYTLDFGYLESNISFHKMYEDDYSNYWVVVGSSLYRFGKEPQQSFRYRELISGLPDERIFPAYPELHKTNGELYYITKMPLAVWQPMPNGEIDCIYAYKDSVYNIYEDSVFTTGSSLNRPHAYSDANTTVITHSKDTLYLLRHNKLKGLFKGKPKDLGDFPASNISKDKNYKVFRLSDKYLFIHTTGSFATDLQFKPIHFDFLENINLNTVYEDNENGLWMATASEGLLYVPQDGMNSRSFTDLADLNSEVVSIEATENGKVWVAYRNGQICCLENDSLHCFQVSSEHDNDKSWFIRDAEILQNQLLIIVGNYEVQIFNIENFASPKMQEIINLNQIKHISKLNEDTCYFSDYTGTYSAVIKDGVTGIQRLSSLRNRNFFKIKEKEFYQSHEGFYMRDNLEDSVMLNSNMSVEHFEIGPERKLWVINRNKGILTLDHHKLISQKSLENTVVRDLHFEDDTLLWAATNEGLIKLLFNQNTGQYDYASKLSLANGLLTNNVTAIFSDSLKLYVGTSEGLNVISRTNLTSLQRGHNLILTEVNSRNRNLSLSDNFLLEPENNAIEFGYVYISPKSAGQITYEYRLEGIDEDWQTTTETSVHYPFLPAGNYRFQLRAKDINGVPSTKNIDLSITVQQHWWKTTWFMVLAFLGGAAAISGFFLIRFRQLRERERERTELNNRIAELKLNALQSQMNPHFVFNVLNSIQDSFVNNDLLQANRHMTDFSKLMRLFLESSDDKYISLTKEISLLSYYVELERMRLDKKFEFEFIVDDDIDPNEMYVPTMILQPIVENAILHGLRHKEGHGQLTISFELTNDDQLLVAVEDNGVGRKRSAEINSQRIKKHQSKASNIIQERIQIINSGSEDQIELNYIDIHENNATGTKVEIKMKLTINK